MREQYPFFRDGDEQTQAVIGEEAASADLDGEYQKPYAILSNKRLYCKNEQGNFIADGKTVRMAGREKPKRPMLALVSALLLVSILLVQLPGDYAIGLLTSRTRKDVESVQNYMDYKKLEAELSQMELPLSREELNAFLPYLERYSDKEIAEIYDDCGLEALSGEGSAALDILQSAETYLEASRADTSELSEAAIEASLALLTGKFDPLLGTFLSELGRSYYISYEDYNVLMAAICDLTDEEKNRIVQDYQTIIETGNYDLRRLGKFEDSDDALYYIRWEVGALISDLWNNDTTAQFGIEYGSIGHNPDICDDLRDLSIILYSVSAHDGATLWDLWDLLELIFTSEKYRSDPAWAWENANNYAAQLPSTEALEAISQYTQEERTTFLLPLAQAGKDGIAPIRSYQEKLSRMEQNGGSARLSYRAEEMLWNIGGVETNISVLNRSLFFATLCLWAALLGTVALLILFALNLGKLASLVGMVAGVVAAVAALFSNPAPLGYYGAPLLRFGPVVLGLAAAAVSLVVFLKLMKAAAVPTFRLITSAGTFTFREKDYPKAERESFAAAISQGEGNA